MTTADAKQLAPIIQAYADGKQVQIRIDTDVGIQWDDIVDPDFGARPANRYRIKPEPAETPFDLKSWLILGTVVWIRQKEEPNTRWLVDLISNEGVNCIDWTKLFDRFEYSIDLTEWHPCRVKQYKSE